MTQSIVTPGTVAPDAGAPEAVARSEGDLVTQAPAPQTSMLKQDAPEFAGNIGAGDIERFSRNLARLVEEGGRALAAYLRPREQGRITDEVADELGEIVKTLGHVAEYWLADPQRVVELQNRLGKSYLELWAVAAKRLTGEPATTTRTGTLHELRAGWRTFRAHTWLWVTSAYFALGGVLMHDRVAAPLLAEGEMFDHGLTFGGHPVGSAVALKNIEIIEREGLLDNVRANEPWLQSRLDELRSLELVGDIRGMGHFWAIELVADRAVLGEMLEIIASSLDEAGAEFKRRGASAG